jgi:HK97 family phage portal protein
VSLKDRIIGWLGIEQERTITPAQLFNTGYLDYTNGWWSASGQSVTPTTVMEAAQGACVRLLADDISSLPADVFVKQDRASLPMPAPSWMVSPTGRPTDLFLSYVSDWVTSLGTDGNAFTLCLPSVFDPQYLEVLDPQRVDIVNEEGTIYYRVNGEKRTSANILHVPWVRLPGEVRAINPVQASRDSIGLELAARKWAGAFFRNGGTLGGIVEVPAGAVVDQDQLREQFEARHRGEDNWWRPGVLTGGAKYDDHALKPAEADLAPLWNHVLEEAARVYHIPPHLLSSQDPGAAARASVEERGIGYVRHAVRPFTTRFEKAHSLLLPGGQFIKLNMNALMRGDAKTRGEFYNLLLQGKTIKREEVRDLEDLPWDGELGYLETPNNNPPEDPVEEPAQEPRAISIDTVTLADEGARRLADTAKAGAVVAMEEARKSSEKTDERVDALSAKVDDLFARFDREAEDRAAILALLQARNAPPDIRIDGEYVYYQRGAEVERKRVTRDETGRVIGMVAA